LALSFISERALCLVFDWCSI